MKYALTQSLLASAVIGMLASATATADALLEGRVDRIERILANQSGSDLVLQMQKLQTEMQELRGMLETQKLELDKLHRQQRDQYMDIDSRLGNARPAGQGGAGGIPAAADPAKPTLPSGVIDASGADLKPPADAAAPVAPPTPAAPGAVGIPSLPSPETQGGNERDAYAKAFQFLKERNYDDASAAFSALLSQYPQGEFSDNARYWLGETYYVKRDYASAMAQFDQLVQLNPSSSKVPSAMLKIGIIQLDQKDYDKARASLEQVVNDYPNSTEARLARSRLERINRASR